ncbi:MAG: UDP-N-acetylmuramoyl-tripeptide--D-alanyl-D-alanine ligase [Candidatus Eremiobacteraeota bacterium]|nr:UDP-N-acetylmuramoyl-tripeptide--D-alanyl-D-alanine ligase [Candidatus Eremiobacteraeota bacterium]
MNLTLESAKTATGGNLRNADDFPMSLRIVTDTRSLRAGDTFLALRGERFDGHDYLGAAVTAGAGAVIIDEPSAALEGVATLVVSDTKRAYMDLATAARAQYSGRVVAITGSTGKTTVKVFLAQLLRAHFGAERVSTAPANENNEIGVSKLLLATEPGIDVVVVEMGARHPNDIAELVGVAKPHLGVLTNIGEAHLEIFGSHEVLAQTKWGLFSGGAQAILNAHDSVSQDRAPSLALPPRWFGVGEPTLPGTYVVDEATLALTDASPACRLAIETHLPGRHNLANLAAAIAAARVLGVPVDAIVRTLGDVALPPGRYERIAIGDCAYVYDAYNANLSGMLAALEAFATESALRRIAVLASMAELGAGSAEMHRRAGAAATASGVDMLLVGGAFATDLERGALDAGLSAERIVPFENNGAAIRWLRAHVRPGDAVLLKGSRVYRLEEIVEAMRV